MAKRILCPSPWLLGPSLLPSRGWLNLGTPPLCQQDPISILLVSSERLTGRKKELQRAECRQGILKTVISATSPNWMIPFTSLSLSRLCHEAVAVTRGLMASRRSSTGLGERDIIQVTAHISNSVLLRNGCILIYA